MVNVQLLAVRGAGLHPDGHGPMPNQFLALRGQHGSNGTPHLALGLKVAIPQRGVVTQIYNKIWHMGCKSRSEIVFNSLYKRRRRIAPMQYKTE